MKTSAPESVPAAAPPAAPIPKNGASAPMNRVSKIAGAAALGLLFGLVLAKLAYAHESIGQGNKRLPHLRKNK